MACFCSSEYWDQLAGHRAVCRKVWRSRERMGELAFRTRVGWMAVLLRPGVRFGRFGGGGPIGRQMVLSQNSSA